eukprot:scaffold667_cov262-Pinguiococcus_pyrenoidosus.AAC.6
MATWPASSGPSAGELRGRATAVRPNDVASLDGLKLNPGGSMLIGFGDRTASWWPRGETLAADRSHVHRVGKIFQIDSQ